HAPTCVNPLIPPPPSTRTTRDIRPPISDSSGRNAKRSARRGRSGVAARRWIITVRRFRARRHREMGPFDPFTGPRRQPPSFPRSAAARAVDTLVGLGYVPVLISRIILENYRIQ